MAVAVLQADIALDREVFNLGTRCAAFCSLVHSGTPKIDMGFSLLRKHGLFGICEGQS